MATRYTWERTVRRWRMPGLVKLVAYTLAQYGDPDGTNVRPGVQLLAQVCGQGESTVRRHIETLRCLGLLERVSNGGGPGRVAALYRLTIPQDLAEDDPRLLPVEVEQNRPRPPRGPAQARNSAQSAERSTADVAAQEPRNSAPNSERSSEQNSAELRSPDNRTPLSLAPNSAHQPCSERPPPKDQGKASTQGAGSAPALAEQLADAVLAAIPDKIARETRRERVVQMCQDHAAAGWTPKALAVKAAGWRWKKEDGPGLLITRLREDVGEAPPPVVELPPWCGQCHEETRLDESDPDKPRRCPRCHPFGSVPNSGTAA